jgi:hypothetical protein
LILYCLSRVTLACNSVNLYTIYTLSTPIWTLGGHILNRNIVLNNNFVVLSPNKLMAEVQGDKTTQRD